MPLRLREGAGFAGLRKSLVDRLLTRPDKRFWTSAASHRNAIDLFPDAWASDLAEIDPTLAHFGVPLFKHDPRPRHAAAVLGHEGRFDGMRILELGPLEGAHSYQLEQLGAASITAIESNAQAFLKCLVIKNILELNRTTFLLGDCVNSLEADSHDYDLIFASGILYHMENPLELIRLLGQRTRRVFLWTMYFDAAFVFSNGTKLPHRKLQIAQDGLSCTGYELVNWGRFRTGFWGGNRTRSCWLELDTIIEAFRHYGFANAQIIEKDDAGEYGPAVSIAFSKVD